MPRYVTGILSSGNVLVAEVSSKPQNLYIIPTNEFSKYFSSEVTTEINDCLKHKVTLTPDLEFQIEKFTISQSSNLCAVGRHCLSILQPVGEGLGYCEIDSYIYRCFSVCRYLFHPKSHIELIHVAFSATEKEHLSVLSSDSTLRLFDVSCLKNEAFVAPFRTVNLVHPHQSIPSVSRKGLSSSSRISLAKCEPFVSVIFFPGAKVVSSLSNRAQNSNDIFKFMPFLTLRSNGDVFLGFVDISNTSAGEDTVKERGSFDCRLAGPLKVNFPENDNGDEDSHFLDLNACSMELISSVNFTKITPLLIIGTASGYIGHYLLICDPDNHEMTLRSTFSPTGLLDSDKSSTLTFPDTCLLTLDRLNFGVPDIAASLSSPASWIGDSKCLKIMSKPNEDAFSYLVAGSFNIFRVSLPWLDISFRASPADLVCRLSDDPTFVESLFSLDAHEDCSISLSLILTTNSILIAAGPSLYCVPACAKTAMIENQPAFSILDDPLFNSEKMNLSTLEDFLPPSEDFVAVVQRSLAREANLNPKLLSNSIPASTDKDSFMNNLYMAGSGATALLAKEYFAKTDSAARQIARLNATCDAQFRHVTTILENRINAASEDLRKNILSRLALRLDNMADRLVPLTQRLAKLAQNSCSKQAKPSNALDEVCPKEFSEELAHLEVNLAQINSLCNEVSEKATYLGEQIDQSLPTVNEDDGTKSFETPPTNLIPLFKTLKYDIKGMVDQLNNFKEDADHIDSLHERM